jgi:hypothetical protein
MKPTYFRNLRANGAVIIRTADAPAGRLITPGATSCLLVDPGVLADPHIQRRLAQTRVAVLDSSAWHADLRQRRAADLNWSELIARAERAEIDRLRQMQQRQRQLSAAAVRGGRAPRTKGDDEWLRREWIRGTPRTAIARRFGITVQGVTVRAQRLGLPPRSRNFRPPPQSLEEAATGRVAAVPPEAADAA